MKRVCLRVVCVIDDTFCYLIFTTVKDVYSIGNNER